MDVLAGAPGFDWTTNQPSSARRDRVRDDRKCRMMMMPLFPKGAYWTVFLSLLVAAVPYEAAMATQPQQSSGQRSERYVPAIWVDPDGCEHWVIDDGAEGFMTPHVRRDGTPVCRATATCAIFGADQLFRTGSANISDFDRRRLERFFRTARQVTLTIEGHTDSRASDAYNLRLSQARARSVARIARQVGARVADVQGFGERRPRASNATSAGRAQNRRVEVKCSSAEK